jgi:hypothetical protein
VSAKPCEFKIVWEHFYDVHEDSDRVIRLLSNDSGNVCHLHVFFFFGKTVVDNAKICPYIFRT